jgi:hypothetical protein
VPFGSKTGWVLQHFRSLHRPEAATSSVDTFFLTKDGYPVPSWTSDPRPTSEGKRTVVQPYAIPPGGEMFIGRGFVPTLKLVVRICRER